MLKVKEKKQKTARNEIKINNGISLIFMPLFVLFNVAIIYEEYYYGLDII